MPSTFGDTVDSIYDAGTISSGDSRISVVPSFSVPAGGSYDLTVTINRPILMARSYKVGLA
jgi:hypothetical protein